MLGAAFGLALAISTTANCTPDLQAAGACVRSENDGSQIDLIGEMVRAVDQVSDQHTTSAARDPDPSLPVGELCGPLGCRPLYEAVGPPDVTIEDLASFRPATPALSGEPEGFGVVGMPTNLVASASTQDVSGTLFDWDVTVRFTPAWYLFDHGDGTSLRAETGGATWESLGVPQFTTTPTSHVYRARGEYTVDLDVQFSAAVDFGSGVWRDVAGYVTASGGSYDVRVVDVRTALVDRTCLEDPSGPGC